MTALTEIGKAVEYGPAAEAVKPAQEWLAV